MLRVCTLLLSSAYFEGELVFEPEYDFVDDTGCTKRKITFQDDRVNSQSEGADYEEWMIGCRPQLYYASYQAEYFFSRVYNSETQVFLYRRKRQQDSTTVVIENMFGDVRFKL
jgi:hypothetical protein